MYTYKRKSKYGAQKTKFMGITFDSKWEAERWGELTAMERAGYIVNLERQIPYDILVNGMKICKYVADFRYSQVDDYGNETQILSKSTDFS